MKFYYNGKRIHVSSLKTLRTKLRGNQPVLNSENTNVCKELITGKVIEMHYPKGTVLKYIVSQTAYSTVGYGKKPSGKSHKGQRKSGTCTNVTFMLKTA